MPKLNDTQSVLLSAAAQRASRSLYPLPDTLCNAGARAAAAILGLMKAGLAEERETANADDVSRTDGDTRFGVFATSAGLTAIGVGPEAGQGSDLTSKPASSAATKLPGTKAAMVLMLLKRDDGATLPDLIAATSWLPHTTRAALTGLRKKGHAIERFKRDEVTTYRIVG